MIPDTGTSAIRGRGLVVGCVATFLGLAGIGGTAAAAAPVHSTVAASKAGAGSPADAGVFTLRFQDDFDAPLDTKNSWTIFNGPGNGTNGPKSSLNTFVQNGVLVLRATQINGVWYGAGVSSAKAVSQTFGKYEMMIRFAPGKGIRTAALIWPNSGWPPEVDFYEISDTYRTINRLTNHYKSSTSNNTMEHASYTGDLTQWHVVGLEWTPTSLSFTLDGVVMKVITSNVPQQSMWFGQNVALKGGTKGPDETTPATVDAELDWVKIYSYTG